MAKDDRQYIVKYVEGAAVWGPFKSASDAAKWAIKNLPGSPWMIRPLGSIDSF